jgi:hypothetical protein
MQCPKISCQLNQIWKWCQDPPLFPAMGSNFVDSEVYIYFSPYSEMIVLGSNLLVCFKTAYTVYYGQLYGFWPDTTRNEEYI